MKQISLFLLLTVWINTIQAQHSKPDTLTAIYRDQPIKLDGKLDETCRSKAVPIENFTQREQNEGTSRQVSQWRQNELLEAQEQINK